MNKIFSILFVAGWFLIIGPIVAHADDVSAQQAVSNTLATAIIEVTQAMTASDSATITIQAAESAVVVSNTAVSSAITAVESAVVSVAAVPNLSAVVDTATIIIQNVVAAVVSATAVVIATPETNTVVQAQAVIDSATAVVQSAAQVIVQNATSYMIETPTTVMQVETATVVAVQTVAIATARVETATALMSIAVSTIETATVLLAAVETATVNSQTQLTQANVAINNAQDAVNALVATIGTTSNVLANTDDAGIRMNLPFNLQLGGVTYSNVYVGSNATITFGVNEGQNYSSTPTAPSISVAGYDWTTWSNGSGVVYLTTTNTLTVAWDVRVYPLTTAETQMTQIRFNADVNPTNGAWAADITVTGPIPNGTRFNYRETTNGTVVLIVDTDTSTAFSGSISQGASFTPIQDSSTAVIQSIIDSATVQIATLNNTISGVVATNTNNASDRAAIPTLALVPQETSTALLVATAILETKTAVIAVVAQAVQVVVQAPIAIQVIQNTLNSVPPAPPTPVEPPVVAAPVVAAPVVAALVVAAPVVVPPVVEPPVVVPPIVEPPVVEPPVGLTSYIKGENEKKCKKGYVQDKKDKTKCNSIQKSESTKKVKPNVESLPINKTRKILLPLEKTKKVKLIPLQEYTTHPERRKCDTIKLKIKNILNPKI